MLLHTFDVLLQEVPSEVSLTFFIAGCPIRCKGCHSPLLWTSNGTELTKAQLQAYLDKYKGLASCVLFMGGDWDPNLGEFLALAKASGYKTALYSGYELEQVNKELLDQLDYLKYGPWVEALGGLGSPSTNQRFMHVPTWTCLNHLFHQRG